jgi:hypothetical protein
MERRSHRLPRRLPYRLRKRPRTNTLRGGAGKGDPGRRCQLHTWFRGVTALFNDKDTAAIVDRQDVLLQFAESIEAVANHLALYGNAARPTNATIGGIMKYGELEAKVGSIDEHDKYVHVRKDFEQAADALKTILTNMGSEDIDNLLEFAQLCVQGPDAPWPVTVPFEYQDREQVEAETRKSVLDIARGGTRSVSTLLSCVAKARNALFASTIPRDAIVQTENGQTVIVPSPNEKSMLLSNRLTRSWLFMFEQLLSRFDLSDMVPPQWSTDVEMSFDYTQGQPSYSVMMYNLKSAYGGMTAFVAELNQAMEAQSGEGRVPLSEVYDVLGKLLNIGCQWKRTHTLYQQRAVRTAIYLPLNTFDINAVFPFATIHQAGRTGGFVQMLTDSSKTLFGFKMQEPVSATPVQTEEGATEATEQVSAQPRALELTRDMLEKLSDPLFVVNIILKRGDSSIDANAYKQQLSELAANIQAAKQDAQLRSAFTHDGDGTEEVAAAAAAAAATVPDREDALVVPDGNEDQENKNVVPAAAAAAAAAAAKEKVEADVDEDVDEDAEAADEEEGEDDAQAGGAKEDKGQREDKLNFLLLVGDHVNPSDMNMNLQSRMLILLAEVMQTDPAETIRLLEIIGVLRAAAAQTCLHSWTGHHIAGKLGLQSVSFRVCRAWVHALRTFEAVIFFVMAMRDEAMRGIVANFLDLLGVSATTVGAAPISDPGIWSIMFNFGANRTVAIAQQVGTVLGGAMKRLAASGAKAAHKAAVDQVVQTIPNSAVQAVKAVRMAAKWVPGVGQVVAAGEAVSDAVGVVRASPIGAIADDAAASALHEFNGDQIRKVTDAALIGAWYFMKDGLDNIMDTAVPTVVSALAKGNDYGIRLSPPSAVRQHELGMDGEAPIVPPSAATVAHKQIVQRIKTVVTTGISATRSALHVQRGLQQGVLSGITAAASLMKKGGERTRRQRRQRRRHKQYTLR